MLWQNVTALPMRALVEECLATDTMLTNAWRVTMDFRAALEHVADFALHVEVQVAYRSAKYQVVAACTSAVDIKS